MLITMIVSVSSP